MKPKSLRRLLYVVGGWALLSLILYAKTVAEGRPTIWALQDASEYAVWAFIAYFLYPLISATPFTLKAWGKLLPLLIFVWHIGGAFAHVAEEVVHQRLVHDEGRRHSVAEVVQREMPKQLVSHQFRHIADFLGVLSLCIILALIRNSRAREIEHSKLMTQLADARLSSLQAQMHPHFLFNTLNTVATLVSTDSKAAVEVLSHLSELLRRAAISDGSHFTTVKEEFILIRKYATIMQYRFGDRVSINIDYDAQLDQTLIPILTLQPLVENAYQHGVGPRSSGGNIDVKGVLSDHNVLITVCDDGLGKKAKASKGGQGMALKNIRDRLHHLYKGKGSLTTEFKETGGYCATITLPYSGSL
ncbi:MAG: sensor histidine kinase [Rhodothermales bacterium]